MRYLFAAIIFGSYFLFMGAYVQLNIIPFTIQSLHQSEIEGGYLFLLTAIGIGLGSFFAGKLSGKEIELAFVPLSTIGITAVFICIYYFAEWLFLVAPLLVVVGFLGGFYIVPTDAFIQAASPLEDRGQNVAAANFFSFLGVIVASMLLALLGNALHMEARTGFLIVGILTFFVGLILAVLLADQLLRFVIARLFAPFWKLKIVGRKNLSQKPVLLVANRTSWLDTLIVMAALPRLIRYIIPQRPKGKKWKMLMSILRLIPVELDNIHPIGKKAVHAIENELKLGHSVCLMLPSGLPPIKRKAWEERVSTLQEHFTIPLVSIHIYREETETRGLRALGSLLQNRILLSFSSTS